MSHSDWEIFRRYAFRVRSLSDFGGNGNTFLILDKSVILALFHPPFDVPLIPYLIVLNWGNDGGDYTSLLPVLFTRTLVDVTLSSVAL
ncbi:hypothetical protein JVU11DRAFT_9991 [Chiua virens]|nr:hypothetical protein JVU11DRAFT_9991 [Chiua virens]